jgi:ubiquinone/menaquinone biosynthesis C-methylase UbiE
MEDAALKKRSEITGMKEPGIKTDGEREFWKEVFSVRLPDSPLDVLDVGCGTGAMGLVLSEMGRRVKGINLSENMRSIGREKAKKSGLSMKFGIGNAEQTQFEDNTFDVVVKRHLLRTLLHPEKALFDWKRIIKLGGFIIVVEGYWDNGTLSAKIRRQNTYTLEKLFTSKLRKEKSNSIDSVE